MDLSRAHLFIKRIHIYCISDFGEKTRELFMYGHELIANRHLG